MKSKIIAVLEGYTDDNKVFLVVVREGDEVGQRLVEGEKGFVDVARLVATAPHSVIARSFLERNTQHHREETNQ